MIETTTGPEVGGTISGESLYDLKLGVTRLRWPGRASLIIGWDIGTAKPVHYCS